MLISASAQVRAIEDATTKLGVELPAGLQAELESARALPPAAAEYDGMAASLNACALGALKAGRDPGLDPQVQRLAALTALANSGIRHAAAEYANDVIAAAVVDHADAILTAMAASIQPDCDILKDAATQLELSKLHGADMTSLRREGKLTVWADACGSSERAAIAIRGAATVLSVIHANAGQEFKVIMLAPDATLDRFIQANAAAGPRDLDAWTIARTGADLRLINTVTEYQQGCARIVAARQEQQRQAAEDQDQKVRREGSSRQWTRVR